MSTTVDQVFANQNTFANNIAANANSFFALINALGSVGFIDTSASPLPTPNFSIGAAAVDPTATQRLMQLYRPPVFAFDTPVSDRPVYTPQTITVPNFDTIPDFTGVAPVLNIPAVPSNALPVQPTAPSLDNVVVPSSPNLVFPVAPTISAIPIPDAPSFMLPTFSASFPTDDLVVPTNTFAFDESPYDSDLLDALRAKLLNDMNNGGYGIEPLDENALWQRGRDRETEAGLLAIEQIMTTQAARGFPLPPGSAQIQLERANFETQQKVSSIGREIMIKRGDLYVENRKFTIQEARQTETMLIQYYMSRMERALNAARYTVDFAIQLYNANVGRFNARVAAYSAQVAAFDVQIRAALAQVEIYRTQMEGAKIQAEIQQQFIDIYRVQLEGVQTLVNIYKTQMEAAQVQTDLQRLRLDAFKTSVEAYAQQVQAKVAEFGMYESQVRGQTAIVQTYATQAQAYASIISGYDARARIAATRVDAQAKAAQIALDSYKTDLERYTKDLDIQIRTVDAHVAEYGSQVAGYNADITGIAESYRLAQASYQIDHDLQVKNADIAIRNAQHLLQTLLGIYDIKGKAAMAGGDFFGKAIMGAQGALNAIVSAS